MIELTKEQIQKIVSSFQNLADKNLSYEEFKGKLSQIGITGSDEDIKAFKAQIMDIYNKRDKLVKLSEDELEKAVGGISEGVKKGVKIAGVTVGSLFIIALGWFGWKYWDSLPKKTAEEWEAYNKKLEEETAEMEKKSKEEWKKFCEKLASGK